MSSGRGRSPCDTGPRELQLDVICPGTFAAASRRNDCSGSAASNLTTSACSAVVRPSSTRRRCRPGASSVAPTPATHRNPRRLRESSDHPTSDRDDITLELRRELLRQQTRACHKATTSSRPYPPSWSWECGGGSSVSPRTTNGASVHLSLALRTRCWSVIPQVVRLPAAITIPSDVTTASATVTASSSPQRCPKLPGKRREQRELATASGTTTVS